MLNSYCSTDWLKTSDIVSSRSTLHYITLHYITLLTFLHFGAFVRFFPHIQIFSRLYNLPPRQAFWSSRRPDSLAIKPTVGRLLVGCRPTVGRQTTNCRSTVDRQTADSRPTGFLGSSSSQLPCIASTFSLSSIVRPF